MITIYQRTLKQKHFKTVTQAKRGCWIAVENPTPEELDLLTEQQGLERGHLTDALDPDEVPRSETEGSDVYIFTRVPILDGSSLVTKPLLFILTPTVIVTVSSERFAFFDALLKSPKNIFTTQRIPFLIANFFEIISSYNSSITSIKKHFMCRHLIQWTCSIIGKFHRLTIVCSAVFVIPKRISTFLVLGSR